MRRSKPDPADEPACRRTGLDLLARREHSRLELSRKLTARGFESPVVAAALDALEESGALAAERFTESFIRARVAKGQGPVRIRAELAQRGIGADAAEQLLKEADLDWRGLARTARAKRFGAALPRDYAERARQARFLEYRGFDGAAVRAALELDADSD
jgi:regulatory protein